MATLATTYTNARTYVPGANTTNMPDATLLVPANRIYLLLYQTDPLPVANSPTAMGWSLAAPALNTAIKVGTYAGYSRVTAVRNEGASGALTTTGTLMHYFTEPEYELERATYPTTGDTPRYYTLKRTAQGTWALRWGPAADGVSDYNFSVEGEVEPTALSSGASTLLLPDGRIAQMDLMLAWWIASQIAPEHMADLAAQIGPCEEFNKFLADEQSRGEMVDGKARGRR